MSINNTNNLSSNVLNSERSSSSDGSGTESFHKVKTYHTYRSSAESGPYSVSTNESLDSYPENRDLDTDLRSRFDLEDAFRLRSNMESDQDLIELDEEANIHPVEPLYSKAASLYGERAATRLTRNSTNLEKVFTNKDTGDLLLPPDGGYGWVCVACSFLIFFNTWGCNAGFGVFLSFYLNHDTYPGASKYDYALIAGLTVFMGQILCPFVAVLMRIIGIKPTMLIGVVFLLAGFLMASWSTKLWELYMTQGFLAGCSIGFIFVPATTIIPGWFLKRRALALGFTLLGTGAGGCTFGLATNKMIADDGNTHWCLRMLAITCSISCLIAIVFIKQRNPVPPIGFKSWSKIKREWNSVFSYKIATRPTVLLLTAWFTFAIFGYNLLIFTLGPYSITKGLSSHDASTITAILNGCQAIGRPLMGFMGDRYGRTNITVIFTFLLMVFIFTFWITAHTFLQLIFFSIMLGLCVGVANVMSTVLIADLSEPKDFLASWGAVNSMLTPMLLFSEVIAQALVKPHRKKNPYIYTQSFSGLCYFVALILILMLRERCVHMKVSKKLKDINEKLLQFSSNDNEGGESHSSDAMTVQENQLSINNKEYEKKDYSDNHSEYNSTNNEINAKDGEESQVNSEETEKTEVVNSQSLSQLKEKYEKELEYGRRPYFRRMFKRMRV